MPDQPRAVGHGGFILVLEGDQRYPEVVSAPSISSRSISRFSWRSRNLNWLRRSRRDCGFSVRTRVAFLFSDDSWGRDHRRVGAVPPPAAAPASLGHCHGAPLCLVREWSSGPRSASPMMRLGAGRVCRKWKQWLRAANRAVTVTSARASHPKVREKLTEFVAQHSPGGGRPPTWRPASSPSPHSTTLKTSRRLTLFRTSAAAWASITQCIGSGFGLNRSDIQRQAGMLSAFRSAAPCRRTCSFRARRYERIRLGRSSSVSTPASTPPIGTPSVRFGTRRKRGRR